MWQSLDHENFFPGSGVLFATVTVRLTASSFGLPSPVFGLQGDWSERIEALSDAEVQAELMDVLHAMYPDMDDMPEPTSILFHRWYNDPLTRGSYSNWPASFFQEHHDNLRATVDERLWFTGEHCSQKYFVRGSLLCPDATLAKPCWVGFPAWRLVRRTRRWSRTR